MLDTCQSEGIFVDDVASYDDAVVYFIVLEVGQAWHVVWSVEADVNRLIAVEPYLAFLCNNVSATYIEMVEVLPVVRKYVGFHPTLHNDR